MSDPVYPARLVWQPANELEPMEQTVMLSTVMLSSLRWAAMQAREQGSDAATVLPVRLRDGSVVKQGFRLRRIVSLERIRDE